VKGARFAPSFMEDGKLKIREFILIEAGAPGPVPRLRHFDPALAGWEERSKPPGFRWRLSRGIRLYSRALTRPRASLPPKL
jgi:Domain of unknown function (DUF6265)